MSTPFLLEPPNQKSFPVSLTPAAADVTAVVSASRLKCYQTCRRQFYFRYMLGLKKPAGAALIVGQALHRMLEIWNHARWDGNDPAHATAPERFEEEWQTIVEA